MYSVLEIILTEDSELVTICDGRSIQHGRYTISFMTHYMNVI
jgi:hypothetical protein